MAAQQMLITWENCRPRPVGEWPLRQQWGFHQPLGLPRPALEPWPQATIRTTVY